MWQSPVVMLMLGLIQAQADAASVMRRETRRHLVLHQVDGSSPVDGLLFTQGGEPFKTDDFKKICGTSAHNLACFQDLPIPVVRTPKANMIRILEELPSVRLLSLPDNIPSIVDMLKKKFGGRHVRLFLDAYTQSGIPMPAELSKRCNEEQFGGSSFNELAEHGGDDHTPDDAVTEEDPKTHQKSINHHYLLHQQYSEAEADGVLTMKSGGAFTTEELDRICAEDSDLIKCVKGLPMVVVRASKEHLTEALKRIPEVEFDELKKNLPDIVEYLKAHVGLKDAGGLVREYKKAGVPLPVKEIQQEFQKEGKDLDE